jgi:hypothetical protein
LLQENRALGYSLEFLQERIAELELGLEDAGWIRMNFESEMEFSRAGLQRITALSRLFFLKNPLINRAVTLQSMYVWGQGVSIKAAHPEVDAIVQKFLDDPKNKVELTGHQARSMKEQDLQVEGNLFFVLFPHTATGRVRVRTIPVDEIQEIITNPEDGKEPWYYKRTWAESKMDAQGVATTAAQETAYYPDWRYQPLNKPLTIGGDRVEWTSPVYHVRVGGLSNMRFGLPETYSGLDWARAYKEFLEDWATIVRAYAKFAFKATSSKGGKKGIAAMKAKLGTTMGASSSETNPPPGVGSIAVMAEGNDLTPIRTAGATTKADDGRRMLLMVAAATGLPETFFGDVSVGTLATANSLDRPTELKFRDRQELWKNVLSDILQFTIDKRATAILYPKLRGALVWNDERDEREVVLMNDPETGEPIDRHIDIDFPSILEHDKDADIKAIISAATLDGKTLSGTMDLKLTSRLLLTALGQDDIDDLLDTIFPEDEEGKVSTQAEESFMEAVRSLREAVKNLEPAA